MRQEDYAQIKDAVERAGYFTTFHPCGDDDDWLIVLVTRCTAGRLHGNSFKIRAEQGRWYLITWAPVAYLIPAAADLEALCLECLRSSEGAFPVVPPEIVSRYGLARIAEEDEEDEEDEDDSVTAN